jgi:hypothetical protein
LPTVAPAKSNGPSLEAISTDVLSLYQRLLPSEYFEQLRRRGTLCENNRVYNAAVVMWLMIQQRLRGGNMASSVLDLVCGLPPTFWPRPCQRLLSSADGQRRRLSVNTGAYNEARQDLDLRITDESFDRATNGLTAAVMGELPDQGGRIFFVDGTSMRGAHSAEMCRAYPPGSNQHGEAHWPVLRVLVAHDLHTGLALRPQWGPMYGTHAVSEQGLFEAMLERLPRGSTVLADINFGVFSVAYAADQRGNATLLRLQATRAKRMLGGKPLQDGIDQRVQWRPSREERKQHPQLPVDACVVGRIIVRQVQPGNGGQPFLLALFTTHEEPAEALVDLYGKRWNIEVDLRTLKSTLQLEQLTCTSPEMVAKEIVMGMLAYNLVRAVTFVAAQAAGVAPRAFSFTQVRNVINAFAPRIAAAKSVEEAQRLYEDLLYYASQARLPKRSRPRGAYPRAVWGHGERFPSRRK